MVQTPLICAKLSIRRMGDALKETQGTCGETSTHKASRIIGGLLKRGVCGVLHHVGDGYLPTYLGEFEFRFNRRKMTDAARFAALMA